MGVEPFGGRRAFAVRAGSGQVLTVEAALRGWVMSPRWTSVYGMARTLLALGTFGTLATTSISALFVVTPSVAAPPSCSGVAALSLFCIAPHDKTGLELSRWIASLTLLIVASGWRPRITALPHWWISASLIASATAIDGGDHVTAVLTLLLLPIALTDDRAWHWEDRHCADERATARMMASFAGLAIRVQVAAIYLQSSLAKLGVPEWVDGTALYYWMNDPSFGPSGWLRPFVMSLMTSRLVVAVTWGTIVLEFALALGLVVSPRARPYLLVFGISLHAAIGVVIGLTSFALAMIAALILYLHPLNEPFEARWLVDAAMSLNSRWLGITAAMRRPGAMDDL